MSECFRILCFGNPLHGDDGFGPAVSLALRRMLLQTQVDIIDCGTRGIDALHFFENCQHVLIIDAMAGQEAGRLHLLAAHQIPMENSGSGGHGAGVGYLFQRQGKKSSLFGLPLMFVSLNTTTTGALWDAIRGRFLATWQRSA